MGENIEIKARATDVAGQREAAERMSDAGPTLLIQTDTFFAVSTGRLKLRTFAAGGGELIQYQRSDCVDPAKSCYTIVPTDRPDLLNEALSTSLGVLGVVRKRRMLYLVGQTRIHFDEVEGLGDYIELEVVLRPGQAASEGVAIAEALMRGLGISSDDLVDCAYIDLLGAARAHDSRSARP